MVSVQNTKLLLLRHLQRQLIEIYLARYGGLNPFDPVDMEAWKLLIAAAHLEEGITEEEEQQLAFIESFLSTL